MMIKIDACRLRIAPKDAVPVALLFLVVVTGAAVSWTELDLFSRALMITFGLVFLWQLRQVQWKAIFLEDQWLVVRDHFRRERRVPYTAVEQIAYYRRSSFRIFLEDGRSVSFDPNTTDLEPFIRELLTRVRAVRTVLLTGDLEFE